MKHLRKFNEAAENYGALQKAIAFIEDKMLKYIDSGEIIKPNIKEYDGYICIIPKFRFDIEGHAKVKILNDIIEAIKLRYKAVSIFDNEMQVDVDPELIDANAENYFDNETYIERLNKTLSNQFDNLKSDDNNGVITYYKRDVVIYTDCYNGWYDKEPCWQVNKEILEVFKHSFLLDYSDYYTIVLDYLNKKHNKNYHSILK